MAQPILPFAHPLFLCDQYLVRDRGKVDFLGAFDSISPMVYPHTHRNMYVVAHLSGGLGVVSTHIEVKHAATDTVVGATGPRPLTFPDRDVLIRLASGIQGVRFPEPGIYLVELHCDNTCVADTRLRLREPIVDQQGRQG